MHPRANQFPQSISLTTKKRSAQGSMVPFVQKKTFLGGVGATLNCDPTVSGKKEKERKKDRREREREKEEERERKTRGEQKENFERERMGKRERKKKRRYVFNKYLCWLRGRPRAGETLDPLFRFKFVFLSLFIGIGSSCQRLGISFFLSWVFFLSFFLGFRRPNLITGLSGGQAPD